MVKVDGFCGGFQQVDWEKKTRYPVDIFVYVEMLYMLF
jgi:hypothetical protein